jgi:hypothetical protein
MRTISRCSFSISSWFASSSFSNSSSRVFILSRSKKSVSSTSSSRFSKHQRRPSAQEYRLRRKRPAPPIGEPRGALHLNPRPRSALLLLRPLSAGRFPSLRFRPKNMSQHIFQLESELQDILKPLPKPRQASRFPKNSPAMLLLRCPPLNTSPCWSAKSLSLWL